MDYQELYNTIESKVKDIKTVSEYLKLTLTSNIYLIFLSLKNAYYNDSPSLNLSETKFLLDSIVYIEIKGKRTKPFEFIVNKDFYESNLNLFNELEKVDNIDEIDLIIGKIVGYPCVGILSEINAKKHIAIGFDIQRNSTKSQLFAYHCPYNIKKKSIIEAENYLKKIQEVFSIVDIKASLKINEREPIKYF